MTIKRVAVLGAGVMGSGIAAHLANAGVEVDLLDIVPEGAEDRNQLARSALGKLLKTDPAPFMHKSYARRVTPGNMEDDLDRLAEADWIIEVVLEDLKIKHRTYDKIEKYAKKDAVISSNTSTIPLAKLVEGRSAGFQSRFLITHFFNPPRYMRLLEIIKSDQTRDSVVQEIRDFCDIHLGKGVVFCHDTPGFIVNRILTLFLQTAINETINLELTVEEADSVLSKPVGIPKTGVFGLIDLIGIDLMPHLAESLLPSLPENDAYIQAYKDYPFIHQMIEAGYNGRKGKGGFYRIDKSSGEKIKQALRIDPDQFSEDQYVRAEKPRLASVEAARSGLRALVQHKDKGGQYAWSVLSQMLHYAAGLVPEIADDIASVDEAMRLGCNWKQGPFEMIDALGADWFAGQLEAENMEIPAMLNKAREGGFYQVREGRPYYLGTDGDYHELVRPEGVVLLRDVKLAEKPLIKTGSAAVWHVGEGVLCLEFTAKMNALDEDVFDAIRKTVKLIGDGTGDYKGLVVYNEGSHFSAGANLGLALFAINIALWPRIEELVSAGQKAYQALKFAPFPVVAAPSGMALGGGCEVLLHADHVQAHAETYCGLVEGGVGLIPGWGGCKEMLLRFHDKQEAGEIAHGPVPPVRKAFELIGMATVAKSGPEAQDYGYLRHSDGITMNRDRLLYQARAKVLEMAEDYQPPGKTELNLPGPTGRAALDLAVADMRKAGKVTDYDVVVADALARVLSGGDRADVTAPVDEDTVLKLERQEFMTLVHKSGTIARIEHMLETGKPLRN